MTVRPVHSSDDIHGKMKGAKGLAVMKIVETGTIPPVSWEGIPLKAKPKQDAIPHYNGNASEQVNT
jgi:hypothetical protein